jgi:hypothetical protein
MFSFIFDDKMKLPNTKSTSPNNTNNAKEPSPAFTKITCVYVPTNHVGSFSYHGMTNT